ncbi:alpha/beta hydrolase fold domain-containing protein [Scytonema sp. UIC 10036]|nr:alpha/beta hydrolase fold domain-containing protein [Scytonema sp. UIC 10036]
MTKLALAGDSAGSQIAAQMATLFTNSSYKDDILAGTGFDIGELAIKPEDNINNIKGIVLCCGGFNLKSIVESPEYIEARGNFPDFKHFVNTVTTVYSGYLNPVTRQEFDTFSVANYVTEKFPPSFITVGGADSLKPQSEELRDKLNSLGVETDTFFPIIQPLTYPSKTDLEHEYQFNLDTAAGQEALNRIVTFLKEKLS